MPDITAVLASYSCVGGSNIVLAIQYEPVYTQLTLGIIVSYAVAVDENIINEFI